MVLRRGAAKVDLEAAEPDRTAGGFVKTTIKLMWRRWLESPIETPVPIVLSGIQRPFGTQFVFSYSADVGLGYAVDRSATLSNWTTIRTDTANTNPMTVTDTAATNRMNFYRVRRLPNP